jgi:SAM-dependent methyltransferase
VNRNVTRGYGALERLLARLRARTANRLIPGGRRSGRILDIGCGTTPFFLENTRFAERYGLDKVVDDQSIELYGDRGITLVRHDVEAEDSLPFPSVYFDVVTMLAVFEHVEPGRLLPLLAEIHRVLKPGGVYILTTPTPWADRVLRAMAKVGLVSRIEIEEHKDAYSHERIAECLRQAGFPPERIRLGYFELFMNTWGVAPK